MNVKRTERGWAGHFCGSSYCNFRRNTLLEYEDVKLVISTVGNYRPPPTEELVTIGYKRYYETMVFKATQEGPYLEADVKYEFDVENPAAITANNVKDLSNNIDNEADLMHELVVKEFTEKLLTGTIKTGD